MDLVPHIFHEQQEGNLCAQHCLNSLLQGPYFTAIDLADLALQLDQQEQLALDNVGPGAKAVKSQNMDDSGFFSVQVLSHALSIWNLQIIPWGSKEVTDAKSEPEREAAFICNLNEHWYTLRRFGPSTQRWYDLNSMHPHPQYMSATYLGMTLSQLEAEGYSIFVVRPLGSVQSALETSSSPPTVAAPAPKQETPVVEAKPALTERQEMERLRRQRQEEQERALQSSSTGSSNTIPTTADASTKRTRVDHTGEEVGSESANKKNKGDLVTTPSFLPRCEVDILAASMPIVDSASQGGAAKNEQQSFGGSGYRLGGSPPAAAASLPLGFEYEQFGGQGEEDAEWEMMQEAIALSLASQQK
ncbi:Ataxin-3 [Linnemannia schmuckeri]|uniref:Ataxin-3 homolog n=1 Tax=Linnemannia schmuckeri TaxID=64567 RepID=A0A9P5RRI4_9FUNG|nr:Ataxin-3 [Linnemannia schmuckeri]